MLRNGELVFFSNKKAIKKIREIKVIKVKELFVTEKSMKGVWKFTIERILNCSKGEFIISKIIYKKFQDKVFFLKELDFFVLLIWLILDKIEKDLRELGTIDEINKLKRSTKVIKNHKFWELKANKSSWGIFYIKHFI